jgi:hypothetical protein
VTTRESIDSLAAEIFVEWSFEETGSPLFFDHGFIGSGLQPRIDLYPVRPGFQDIQRRYPVPEDPGLAFIAVDHGGENHGQVFFPESCQELAISIHHFIRI